MLRSEIDAGPARARPRPRPSAAWRRCVGFGALTILLGAAGQATHTSGADRPELVLPVLAAPFLVAAVWLRGSQPSTRSTTARALDYAILTTGWFIGLAGLSRTMGWPWATGARPTVAAVAAGLLLTSAIHAVSRGLSRRVVRYGLAAAQALLAATLLVAVAVPADQAGWFPAMYVWGAVLGLLVLTLYFPDDADARPEPGSSFGVVSLVSAAFVVLGLAVATVASGVADSPVMEVAVGVLIALGVLRWAVAVVQAESMSGTLHVERRQSRYLAEHDALTGLPNRRRWDEALSARSGAAHAILMVDLDDFTAVNDSFGTAVGDEVLQVVAARILSCLRPGDVLARISGDEFAVLTPDAGRAHELAVGIRTRVCLPVSFAAGQVSPRLSVGVCDRPGDEPAETMRRADAALATAKRHHRGSYVVWDAGVLSRGPQEMQLREDLVAALHDGAIRAAYQPVFAASGRLDGFEALARWTRHGQPVAPGVFLVVAEELGLMPDLDLQILRQAVRTAAGWTAAGRPLSIGVNLGQATLADPRLPQTVAELLSSAELAPASLIVELPETQYVESDPACLASIDHLRAQGVRFALDDFGVGYSSLSRLRRIPSDVVKIDRQFITPLEQEPADPTIVRWVCELAHATGAKVVAEGVETSRQLALVREAGVDAVQGFLLGRPTDADRADLLVVSAERSLSGWNRRWPARTDRPPVITPYDAASATGTG